MNAYLQRNSRSLASFVYIRPNGERSSFCDGVSRACSMNTLPLVNSTDSIANGNNPISRRASRLLAGQKWLAGDQFSVADIDALIAVDFGCRAIKCGYGERPDLTGWHERIGQRAAIRTAD